MNDPGGRTLPHIEIRCFLFFLYNMSMLSPNVLLRCPLCGQATGLVPVRGPDSRTYWKCGDCFLIHADAACHLSPEDEAKRYRLHTNGPQNQDHVRFLEQALAPVREGLRSGISALDFGCGPVPVLPVLLKELGIDCDIYDPVFFPDPPPRKQYAVVFATECVEHFRAPVEDWQLLVSFVQEGGRLVVMTELWQDLEAFRSWSYARDLTHVSFYHARTLDRIARAHGLTTVHTDGMRVTVFMRRLAGDGGLQPAEPV